MNTSEDLRILETVMSFSPDLICVVNPKGNFLQVSAACQRVLGYTDLEMVNKPFADVLHPDNRRATLQKCLDAFGQDEAVTFDSQCLSKDGREVFIAWSALRTAANELLVCIGRDVTAERQAARQAHEQDALHCAIINHCFEMVALLNEQGVYTYVGGATEASLGYPPEHLVGRSAFDYIHPDDLERVQNDWNMMTTLHVFTTADFRFRAANGEWRWVETTVYNELDNPAIRAFVASSRDVTERHASNQALAASEQRFRLLFETSATLAVFQATDGVIVDANLAFLNAFQRRKHQVVNRPLSCFLPKGLRLLFAEKLAEAVTGHRVKFRATVNGWQGQKKLLSVSIIPLQADGQTVGVYVMTKDVTELATAQHLVKKQEEQLSAIMASITDAVLSIDKAYNLTYLNPEAERALNLRAADVLGKSFWLFFPDEIGGVSHQQYQRAFETGETARFITFCKFAQRWFEVRAYPSPEGLSVYLADVTKRMADEKQLKLLAKVAQGTDNAVVITDAAGRTEWVNEAYEHHTGYTLAEVLGKKPGEVLQGPETDPAAVQRFRERLALRKPFSVTILNYKKSGKKLWLAIDVTPIINDAGELTQWVAIEQNINFRKEVEASQAKMTQDLYRHNRDLQQFTYVISHNLRAPLANALGLASLLTRIDKNSDVFATSLANLRQSMMQADTVLRDLNLVLSIRDKQDVVAQESVALAEICQEVVHNLQENLQQCDGEVKCHVEDGLMMQGNRAYLYSIFYNLLSNSIKYRSEERSLEVVIDCFRGEHGGPTISFTDNGSGFDMFRAGSDVFQLYKRFHTNQRGRGIGLFLVKTHVEAMNGKIEVTSHVNMGTRFLIHLEQR